MSRTIRSDEITNDYCRSLNPLIRKYEESNIDKLQEYQIVPKNRLKQYKANNPDN